MLKRIICVWSSVAVVLKMEQQLTTKLVPTRAKPVRWQLNSLPRIRQITAIPTSPNPNMVNSELE